MAQLQATLSGQTIGEVSITYEMDDDDAARILQWGAAHPQYGAPVEDESAEDGERAPTPDEIVRRIFRGFVHGTLANVHRHEVQQARAAAEAKVTLPTATEAQA